MKPSSGYRALVRIFASVTAIVVALGYYGHVRAQSATGGNSKPVIPLRPLAPLSSVAIPPVFGMEGILADKTAAVQLGKALFWDMQAGSDDVQACASCHFNAGADSRSNNQVNPGQAGGDNTFQVGVSFAGLLGPNYHYNPGTPDAGFGGYHDGDFPFHKVANPKDRYSVVSDVNDVSGSEGVFATSMGGIALLAPIISNSQGGVNTTDDGSGGVIDANSDAGLNYGKDAGSAGTGVASRRAGANGSSASSSVVITSVHGPITSMELTNPTVDTVFSYPDPNDPSRRINVRKTTGRNTPSVVNAVFNYRNFWDGRAQNVCNGANPFGARDKESHLLIGDAVDGKLGPALVHMENSALCSQALGPILSSVEMSADGRNLRQVGKKLLNRKPLARQMVDPTDSVLGGFSSSPEKGINTSYAALIQKAFLPEWWNSKHHVCQNPDGSRAGEIDPTIGQACPAGTQDFSEMEYNFSLFWGVAIQMYESTLVSDQTPFDNYLQQQQTYTLTGDNQKNSYTIQLQPGLTPRTITVISLNPDFDFSDQDVYAFDDGFGRFSGTGVDGTIDYAAGSITVNFEDPPVSTVPVKISYSLGPTPLTDGQLRGLAIFQGKGRCIVCHGGPELSNASVGTVSAVPLERMSMGDLAIRVYDTGFYHIGVRAGADDGGLAGADPVAGLPLSLGEELRQRTCNDPAVAPIIPGRPGDGISQAPLRCNEDIARGGFFKTPQLRNVALTAPYFHNGGQLTLEQVVEFYNRGGDFNVVEELNLMDPDINALGLGLTLQEQQDLVDFLRNALTDPRVAAQSAPFDHPQLFAANGHPQDANGYPVQNDPNQPGQAVTQFMEVPATGANGGKPLPTFLENVRNVMVAERR